MSHFPPMSPVSPVSRSASSSFWSLFLMNWTTKLQKWLFFSGQMQLFFAFLIILCHRWGTADFVGNGIRLFWSGSGKWTYQEGFPTEDFDAPIWSACGQKMGEASYALCRVGWLDALSDVVSSNILRSRKSKASSGLIWAAVKCEQGNVHLNTALIVLG